MLLGIGASGGALFDNRWNSADKGSNITLSGSDLIAASTGAGMVRGRTSRASGGSNYQYEMTINAMPSTSYLRIGIARADADLSQALGATANGTGLSGNSIYWTNGSNFGAGSGLSVGDVIGVVFVGAFPYVSFYQNGTLNISVFGIGAGTWFPAFGATNSGVEVTLNCGTSAFAYPIGGAAEWGTT